MFIPSLCSDQGAVAPISSSLGCLILRFHHSKEMDGGKVDSDSFTDWNAVEAIASYIVILSFPKVYL